MHTFTWDDMTPTARKRVLAIQHKSGLPRMRSIGAGTARIRRLYDSATPTQKLEGSSWYIFANHIAAEYARRYNLSVDSAARVFAALSASAPWHVVSPVTGNVRGTIVDAGKLLAAPSVNTPTFASRVQRKRAIAVIDGAENVRLGREKIHSFADNIANPMTSLAVTVDIWMLRALTGAAVIADNFDSYVASRYAYAYHAEPIRRVAASLGVLPHVVQATVWGVIRT